jgi:hypothetical protein
LAAARLRQQLLRRQRAQACAPLGVSDSFIWKPAADSTFSVANGRCAVAAQPPALAGPRPVRLSISTVSS